VITVPLRAISPPGVDIRGMTCDGWLTHWHRRRSQGSVGAQRSPSDAVGTSRPMLVQSIDAGE